MDTIIKSHRQALRKITDRRLLHEKDANHCCRTLSGVVDVNYWVRSLKDVCQLTALRWSLDETIGKLIKRCCGTIIDNYNRILLTFR